MVTTGLNAIAISDGELWFAPAFLSPQECAPLLQQLQQELAWRQDEIQMFGRRIAVPRLQAWYGDQGCDYCYSGLLLRPLPWSDSLRAVKERLEARLQHPFNAVLANLYRQGSDSVGWHADNEPELGANPVIASLSLGAERLFCLRHRRDKRTRLRLQLPSGSLLVMAGTLQHHWLHTLPKTRSATGPRINLSFRTIIQAQSASSSA